MDGLWFFCYHILSLSTLLSSISQLLSNINDFSMYLLTLKTPLESLRRYCSSPVYRGNRISTKAR